MTRGNRSHDGWHPMPARDSGRWFAIAIALVTSVAQADGRNWEGVQLAWRGDPRAVADAPLGGEVPQGRRPSRRSQRRSMRRGQPQPEFARPGIQPPVSPPSTADLPAAETPVAIQQAADTSTLVHRDQPYGTAVPGQPRQRFDIHLPAACSGGRLPLVIWIAGTDWRNGTKADCPVTWLVSHGYVVASVGYRTTDTAAFPAQLDDCRAAVATLVADAETWGVDPARICVAGSAAGGHLAALVGLDAPPRRAGFSEASARSDTTPHGLEVAAVCTFGAPTLLTALGPDHDRAGSAASRLVGGPLPEFREAARHASPLTHVSADDPPALIVHGGRDPLVRVDQAVQFEQLLKAAGVDATLVVLDGATDASPAEDKPAGTALIHFLDRVLGPGAKPLTE